MKLNAQTSIEYSYQICKGVLHSNPLSCKGIEKEIHYDFDCDEYQFLKSKYKLNKIAGIGTEFERVKRLLSYFSKRLKHNSMYDNHVPCNAIDLLDYSFNNPEQGINCLNKSKILVELCLAIGIKARMIIIMPYYVYDMDNHVVAEIFDSFLDKWIMLDPTTNSYFVNKDCVPLSMVEIRDCFAENSFITSVHPNDDMDDLEKLSKKYLNNNWYICKNSFRFVVDSYQGFGEKETHDYLHFAPADFSVKQWEITNLEYKLNMCKSFDPEFAEILEAELKRVKETTDYHVISISSLG